MPLKAKGSRSSSDNEKNDWNRYGDKTEEDLEEEQQ